MSETSGGVRLPLGQGSRASFFVSLTVGEMAFLIEVVVERDGTLAPAFETSSSV